MNVPEKGEPYTIAWEGETGSIIYIDQTLLPGRCEVMRCTTVDDLARAIRRLEIRGAPALGIAGAMGVALAATRSREQGLDRFREEIRRAADLLKGTRPTAVNLSWGIDRVTRKVMMASSIEEAKVLAVAEADAVAREDELDLPELGAFGEDLFPADCTALTHCNAGALACRCWGTALGVIRSAVEAGKHVQVIACETRPLNQGSRLTCWEACAGWDRRDPHPRLLSSLPDAEGRDRSRHRRCGPDHARCSLQQDRYLHARSLCPLP
ncbi:MAG: S-methyl-5-thioribose-1-phosphate isomerase [Methanoculleus sp.]